MNASIRTVAALIPFIVLGSGCRGEGELSERPNILVVLTDDQVSSSLRFMPKVDSLLAREGVSFSNFYVNNPICCPSRVTILTGKYHHNHRIETAPRPSSCGQRFMEERLHLRSMGRRLQDADYRTIYIGKLLNNYSRYIHEFGAEETKGNLIQGWDDYHILTRNRYYGYVMHEQGDLVRREREEALYQTDEIERLATESIYDAIADEQPFLLFIATDAPHEPATPAERHSKRFSDEKAPRISSFNEGDVSNQPGVSENPLLTEEQIASIDARYRDHIRSLQAVDEMIERLISSLEEVGKLENTFLFFLSDNGLHFGEHRMFWGKGTPFEEAVRVPLIVRGPGVAGGRHSSRLVTNADIFPTILELIGVTSEMEVDGKSIKPLLMSKREDPPWRNAVFFESRHLKRNQHVPRFRAIRTERFKWIEYDDGGRSLYDLESDPHETTNLRGGEWEELAKGLSSHLHDLSNCVGAGCWEAESRPLQPPDQRAARFSVKAATASR